MKNPVKALIAVTVPVALLAPVAYSFVTRALYPAPEGGGGRVLGDASTPAPGASPSASPAASPAPGGSPPLMINGEPFIIDSLPIVPTSAWNGLRN